MEKQIFKITAVFAIFFTGFFVGGDISRVSAETATECINRYCSDKILCCNTDMEGYQNYLDYIVTFCEDNYVPSLCSTQKNLGEQTNLGGQTNQPSGQAPAGGTVLGANNCPPGTPEGITCLPNPLSVSTFDALLNKIIDFIFWVGITIAPVIFIIAGFLFVTSAGDAKKLETAKHMMLYTVIGLVVLLLARGLVAVLKSVIGVQ